LVSTTEKHDRRATAEERSVPVRGVVRWQHDAGMAMGMGTEMDRANTADRGDGEWQNQYRHTCLHAVFIALVM
jgi:hypothetical protein